MLQISRKTRICGPYFCIHIKIDVQSPYWPHAANVLMRRLNVVKPNLQAVGIKINQRHGRENMVEISRFTNTASQVQTGVVNTEGDDIDGVDDEKSTPFSTREPEPVLEVLER